MRGVMFGLAVASLLVGSCAGAQAQTPGFNTFRGGGCAGCAPVARPAPSRPVVRPPVVNRPPTVVVVPQSGWSASGHSSSTVTVGKNTVTYNDSSSYRYSGPSGWSGSNEWGNGFGWFPFGTGSATSYGLYNDSYGSWEEPVSPYAGVTVGVNPAYAPDGMTPLAPGGTRPFYTPDAYVGAVPPGVPPPARVLHLEAGGHRSTCHMTAQGAKANFLVDKVPYWCDGEMGPGKVTKK